MKNDYSLIVLVLITVGISLLLWKYPQNGGSGEGQFHYLAPSTVGLDPIPGFGYSGYLAEIGPSSGPYNPAVSYYDPETNSVKPIAGSGYVPPPPVPPKPDPNAPVKPVLAPPNSVVQLGIAAQTTAQQYATAATNYNNLLNTGANAQKVTAAQKAKDAALAKAQSVRKDFYKQRDTLNAGQKKALAKIISKPPPKTK